MIGADAVTGWLPPEVARDANGFILTGADAAATDEWTADRRPFALETSAPGIFAVGDVRPGRSSASRQASARAGWPSRSCTSTSRCSRKEGTVDADGRHDRPLARRSTPSSRPRSTTVPGYFTTLEPGSIARVPGRDRAAARRRRAHRRTAGRDRRPRHRRARRRRDRRLGVPPHRPRGQCGPGRLPPARWWHGRRQPLGDRADARRVGARVRRRRGGPRVPARARVPRPGPGGGLPTPAGSGSSGRRRARIRSAPRADRRPERGRRAERRDDTARPRSRRSDAGRACCSCGRCSTTGTRRSRPTRSTASASGIAPATRPAGPPCSANGAPQPTCRSTRARTRDRPVGLPPAYIEAGSAEVFRDEAVAFASGIWAAGGSAELHIWAGGFHGFQTIVPTAAVSRAAVQTREAWVRRTGSTELRGRDDLGTAPRMSRVPV